MSEAQVLNGHHLGFWILLQKNIQVGMVVELGSGNLEIKEKLS